MLLSGGSHLIASPNSSSLVLTEGLGEPQSYSHDAERLSLSSAVHWHGPLAPKPRPRASQRGLTLYHQRAECSTEHCAAFS